MTVMRLAIVLLPLLLLTGCATTPDAAYLSIVKQWEDSDVSAGTIAGAAIGAYCPEYSDAF